MDKKVTVIIEHGDEVTTLIFTPDDGKSRSFNVSERVEMNFAHIFKEPELSMHYETTITTKG